uniref:Uncharacterized protein n=2 Tax=Eutreptiella gymnastica TaxID=73025 RepID=A0A7S4FS26_9EUGL
MDYENAIGVYEKALALRPRHIETLDMLAELCINVDRAEDAHRYLTESAKYAPDEAHAKYMYLGQLAESKDALGFYERGLAVLKQQYKDCDDDEDREDFEYDLCSACCSIAELYLTDLCFESNAEQQVDVWLQQCKKYNENFPEMHQLLGSLRISQHKPEEAKEALRKCVDLQLDMEEDGEKDHDHLPTLHSRVELCKLLLEVNDTEYCKTMLYHELDAEDKNPYLWYLLGQCYSEEGRPTTAMKCFTRAKKHCANADVPDEVVADTDACLQKLRDDHKDALDGVDPDGELTEDEDEEAEDEAEDEGAEGAEV